MKSILKTIIVFAVAALVLNSCGEADPILYDGPSFISFTGGTSGDYFIQEANTPYPVSVGIPNKEGSDVTVNLDVIYTSAVAGTHFNLPASVTIPKGEVTVDIAVEGFFENMAGRKDTVIFQLLGDDVASFDTAYMITLQQFCPFDVADFVGDWTANEQSVYEDDPYDPYTVSFEANPNGGDTLITDDIYPYMPVKVTFDASDPANFIWNIPDQYMLTHDSYGPMHITDLGAGSFSSCDMVMGIESKVYVEAGNFEQSYITFTKD